MIHQLRMSRDVNLLRIFAESGDFLRFGKQKSEGALLVKRTTSLDFCCPDPNLGDVCLVMSSRVRAHYLRRLGFDLSLDLGPQANLELSGG